MACLPTGHRLATRRQVRVRDLLEEPIIAAPSVDTVWRDYWILVQERGGRAPNVVYEAPTFEAELQAIAAGRGIPDRNRRRGQERRRRDRKSVV